MANEVSYRHTATGETLYFTIRNTARQMWNTAGTPAFETLTVANWTDYDIAMSESPASSYLYAGDFPAVSGNMVAGLYWVDIYKRAGGSPAISDVLQGSFFGYWDGTAYKFWADDLIPTGMSGVAAAVWDKLVADHLTSGTFGALVSAISSVLTTLAAKIPYRFKMTHDSEDTGSGWPWVKNNVGDDIITRVQATDDKNEILTAIGEIEGGGGGTTVYISIPAATAQASLTGSVIAIIAGATLRVQLTGLGALTSRTKLWVTFKTKKSLADTASTIQITEADDLVYLNGAVASTPAWGTLTVSNAATGTVDIVLFASATKLLTESKLEWDVKMCVGSSPDDDSVVAQGIATVTPGVTHATS